MALLEEQGLTLSTVADITKAAWDARWSPQAHLRGRRRAWPWIVLCVAVLVLGATLWRETLFGHYLRWVQESQSHPMTTAQQQPYRNWVQCMRAQGLPFDDPDFRPDGTVSLGFPPGVTRQSAAFQLAIKTCGTFADVVAGKPPPATVSSP